MQFQETISSTLDDPYYGIAFVVNMRKFQEEDRETKSEELSGEHELWGAVLMDAIECLNHKNARIRDEARYWICSDSEEFNSFRNVCSLFSLDPDAVRNYLEL